MTHNSKISKICSKKGLTNIFSIGIISPEHMFVNEKPDHERI